jgi:hypothetical protein
MCQMLADPAEMTPFQRRQEIAALLARGVLRLRQCAHGGTDGVSTADEKDRESGEVALDSSAKLSPDGLGSAAFNRGPDMQETY